VLNNLDAKISPNLLHRPPRAAFYEPYEATFRPIQPAPVCEQQPQHNHIPQPYPNYPRQLISFPLEHPPATVNRNFPSDYIIPQQSRQFKLLDQVQLDIDENRNRYPWKAPEHSPVNRYPWKALEHSPVERSQYHINDHTSFTPPSLSPHGCDSVSTDNRSPSETTTSNVGSPLESLDGGFTLGEQKKKRGRPVVTDEDLDDIKRVRNNIASAKSRQKRKTNTELMEIELKTARIELLKKDTRIELLEQQVEQLRNERDQAVLASMANGQRRC